MSRNFALAGALGLAGIALPPAQAQEPAVAEELRALRVMVEKQSRQIDTLAEQLVKLRIALEKNADVPIAASAPTVATSTAPAAAAPGEGVPKAERAEFSPDAPKAEAADGKRHVVIKGETLTSIAKHYNLTLTELKKANKEVDERKLQIGQNLTIPTPKSPEKGSEPPAKKEE